MSELLDAVKELRAHLDREPMQLGEPLFLGELLARIDKAIEAEENPPKPTDLEAKERRMESEAKEIFYKWLLLHPPGGTINQIRHVATLFNEVAHIQGGVGNKQYHKAANLAELLHRVGDYIQKVDAWRAGIKDFLEAKLSALE